MTWNHDISTAPLGNLVTTTKTVNGKERQTSEYHVAPVWLALHDGKVCRSYWIPETERAAGRWSGLSSNSPAPIAWQHFVVPEHPHNLRDGAHETMGGLPVAAASGTAEETRRTSVYTRTDRHGTPHVSGVTGGESAAFHLLVDDCGSGQ